MNHEMMLFQARQDFIDMHKDILQGKELTLERYDLISKELKAMDDINFQLILQFVEEVEKFEIGQMWDRMSGYIEQVKKRGDWPQRKHEKLHWTEGRLEIKSAD
jgi:hypothetical protein